MKRCEIIFILDRRCKRIKHHCVTRHLVFARSSFLYELYENKDIRRVKSINFEIYTLFWTGRIRELSINVLQVF